MIIIIFTNKDHFTNKFVKNITVYNLKKKNIFIENHANTK